MSTDFIFRIIGMVACAVFGAYWGVSLGELAGAPAELYGVVLSLLGALVGLILTPILTTRPIRYIRSNLSRVSIESFFSSLAGLITGLILATFLASPLSMLPYPLGQYMPIGTALVFG